MGLATDPTVANLVDEALLITGHRGATTALKDRLTARAMEQIKLDIWAVSTTHKVLEATQTTVTTRGNQRYDVPTDFNELISVTLLDGPDDDRGTARAGSASTLTLAATDGGDENSRIGRELVLTGGTASGKVRTITAFNATSKVATVGEDWNAAGDTATVPDGTTTYLVVSRYPPLAIRPLDLEIGTFVDQTADGRPSRCALYDDQLYLAPVPDLSTYGLRIRYYLQLIRLDLASTRYLNIIKEWENIWMAGLVMKIHQNFDDGRHGGAATDYFGLLQALGNKQTTLGRVAYRDL